METKRNVLIIAYYFPPMGLSGVQRTLKFAKYLPQFGWLPTVLTVTPTGYYAQDYTMLDEIHDPAIEVARVGSLDPNRLFRKKGVVRLPSERRRKILTYLSDTFFIPDNKIGWKRKALRTARKLHEAKNFDVIFATAPPFTDFLIGMELSEQIKRPLVVDYRDAWHEYPYKYYPTPLHKWVNYRLEKKVLRAASRILTTNRKVKELILKRFKFLGYHDVTILPQGFDPEDFDIRQTSPRKDGKMKIAHAGIFYGDRTPKYFLLALKKLFADRPGLKDHIEAVFVGHLQDEHARTIRTLGLGGNVTLTGYLDHGHCVHQLLASDVLWLMVDNETQSPGKVYEYLGAGKTILANVPDGFIRQTLEEAEGCVITDPADVDGIARAIGGLYDQHQKNQLPTPREDVVEKYNRVELTRELSKIFGFLAE